MKKNGTQGLSKAIILILCIMTGSATLADERDDLEKRVHELESEMSKQREMLAKIPLTPDIETANITLQGEIEAELKQSRGFDKSSESAVDLTNAKFAFLVKKADWVRGTLAFEWDDESNYIIVEQAFIMLGNPEETPFFLQTGRFKIPFTSDKDNLVSTPLTKKAFKAKETAILVGLKSRGLYGDFYAFNGATNANGGDDKIEHWGADLGYAMKNDSIKLDVGIGAINSILDTDGLTKAFPNALESNYAAAMSAHCYLNWGRFGLISEYVTATETVDIGSGVIKPKGSELEISYRYELGGKKTTFALGYQATEDLLFLPKSRTAATVGIELLDGFKLSFGYARDKDYKVGDGGTGASARSAMVQLGFEW